MTKDEYKEKLSWLGTIPRTWGVRPFVSVASERSTKGGEGELLSVYLDRGVIKASEGSLGTHAPSESKDNYQEVRPGDFILNNQQAWRGSVGVSFEAGIISPAYLIFELSETLNWKYSNYLLRARPMVDQYMLASQGVGTIQRQVHAPSFKNVLMIVPPLEKQKEIAAFLDERTAAIDKLVEKKERLIELLREKIYSQVLGAEAPSDGDINFWKNIRSEWKIIKARWIFEELKVKNASGEELLAVTQDRGVLPKYMCEEQYVSSTDYSALKLVDINDFVISLRSFEGGIEFSNYKGIVSPAYTVIRLNKRYNQSLYQKYYKYLLKTPQFVTLLNTIIMGIRDGKNVNYSDFRKLLLPVPTKDSIKSILNDIEKYERVMRVFNIEKKLLLEYRTSLIYSAVTGKIKI